MDSDDDIVVPPEGGGWEETRDEERGLEGGYTSGLERDVYQSARAHLQRQSRGPRSYRRSDERIRDDICDRLFGDTGADASEVTIDVSAAVVTLTGTVPDPEDKRVISQIAASVLGVERVDDRIDILAAQPEGSTATKEPEPA